MCSDMNLNEHTLRRLRRRAREGELTYEATINRLLDETVIEVGIKEVVEEALDRFQDVYLITVHHSPTYERPGIIFFKFYTGEANDFEDYIDVFSPDHQILIDRNKEKFTTHFRVMATWDKPIVMDSTENTTIYMEENAVGARPIDLEDGIVYLRDKLENPDQWSVEDPLQLDQIRNYSKKGLPP